MWHKLIEHETGAPGFLAVHMSVHYFVQNQDFEEMRVNWRTKSEFHKFVTEFPINSSYSIDNLVHGFLKLSEDYFHKHFAQ